MFLAFGLITAAIISTNIYFAFRRRPIYVPVSVEADNLERYRAQLEPIRRLAGIGIFLVIFYFAGSSGSRFWEQWLLFRNSTEFGKVDPQFGLDISFFAFKLPMYQGLIGWAISLAFPELKLYSVDISDGAGTGDFRLKLDTQLLYIESNNVSNFYVSGETNRLIVFFSWGNGIFNGEQLQSNSIDVYHRGSNDMTFFPIQSIVGNIYSTGDIILKNRPILPPNVMQHFTGRLIIE